MPEVKSMRGKPQGKGEDVAKRKQVEEALSQSAAQWRNTFDAVEDMVMIVDQEFRVVRANQAVSKALPGAKVIGAHCYALIHGTEAPIPNCVSCQTFRSGEAAQAEVCEQHLGGRWFDLCAYPIKGKDGTVQEVVHIFRDVTERKQMEDALRQSEQSYRILFESTIDGKVVIDAETMEVVLANQTAAKMYGFDSIEEVVGANLIDYIHPDDKERALRTITKDLFEKDLHQVHEFRTLTEDGREIWVSAIGTRIEYQGRLAGLISFTDITERKRAQEDRQRTEQQLQLAGQLAAVGELAAGVAHELNNPLAAVQAFAQLLNDRDDLDETTKSDVQTIYREAQRASRTTANLLSFARRHAPEKRLISINEVIEKALELHAYRMKVNNIDQVMDLDPDLPMTMADFHQMQQVFVNIINNAEQTMTEAHGKGRLCVNTQRVGGMIQVTFTDDGPGIPEDNLKRIFDPFFTTKDVGEGTGLGLSICYSIVQEHGGHLYARSKPGQGATFVVEIPIISEDQLTIEQNDSIQVQGD